ncbi:tetratricopeptide repeat protein [Prosthecobacter sp.]|uniref:tetratricopeptide repeat protein n=1 Tax=Prosthecobacter sp. TaxID=1965333 RepID=UPI00378424FD
MAKRKKLNRNPDHGRGLLKRLAERRANSAGGEDGESGNYVLMDFEVTWDVMPDPAVEALPEAVRERMESMHDLVMGDPKSAVEELRELAAAHPEVPCLTNWLISALRAGSKDDKQEALEICEALFRRMPDYFFARTMLAELWLDRLEVEKAAELMFGPGRLLTKLYPERRVFHVSEIRHWFYLGGRINIFQGEMEAARSHRDILAQVEPESVGVKHLDRLLEGENATMMRALAKMRGLMGG